MLLSSLFAVFERLDRGESILLGDEQDVDFPQGGPWIGVRSSGSTGVPKWVWRRWSDLKAEVRPTTGATGWRWASPFQAQSFAGVQVALQAWATGGEVVSIDSQWDHVWDLAQREPWQALSCTPTYLDLLLQNQPTGLSPLDPLQITLGGEVLRPICGVRFATRFPRARFTVIYAAAEWGVLLKTHRLDGWYEVDSLDRRRSKWRIEKGILELLDVFGVWQSTGDGIERDGNRVRILGRADRVVNVAGTKVHLDEIGRMAELVPGVRRALALAEPNAISGQIIVLHYSPESGIDPCALESVLAETLRDQLPKPAWPRRWILDNLPPEKNAKRRVS